MQDQLERQKPGHGLHHSKPHLPHQLRFYPGMRGRHPAAPMALGRGGFRRKVLEFEH